MTYWPFSITGTLLNDIIRRIWHKIYMYFNTTYTNIANYVFRNVRTDIDMIASAKQSAEAKAEVKRAQEREYTQSGYRR